MNKLFTYCFFIVLFVSCKSSAQEDLNKASKPNLIFILADDLGINALNCYGNDLVESPNIDKLFTEGMHFTNGYSNDPTCAPSRASIMTGQYVPRHQIYRVTDRFKKDEKTLMNIKYLPPENHRVQGEGVGVASEKIMIPEALKTSGYNTAAYGKWHLGKGSMGIPNQGFDEGFAITGHYTIKTEPKQDIHNPDLYASDLVTEKTINFIKKSVKEDKPFFAYVPFYLVHKPLEPKAEYLKYFKEKLKGNSSVGEDETKVLAMIKSLDENIGQILNAVKSLGIEEETIIIFTSDNGHYKTESNIFNQPYRGVKGQTFEGGIRVPYIFKWKNNIEANSVSKEPIIHVDLYPTILEMTGTKNSDNTILDGESILPVLTGNSKTMQRESLIWEYTNYSRYNIKQRTFASQWVNVIQKEGYKLTEVIETNNYYLYNLNSDPYETNEVSNSNPEIVQNLKKSLEQWKIEVGYEGPKPNPAYKK